VPVALAALAIVLDTTAAEFSLEVAMILVSRLNIREVS
jgi:hypothetical protein